MSLSLHTSWSPLSFPQFSFLLSYPDGPAHHRVHVKFTLARTHNLKETTAYAHLENIAGDPNLTIEVIQRELKRVEQQLGKLPPILALQLDNCFRENKNSYVINFCAWLVERGTGLCFLFQVYFVKVFTSSSETTLLCMLSHTILNILYATYKFVGSFFQLSARLISFVQLSARPVSVF